MKPKKTPAFRLAALAGIALAAAPTQADERLILSDDFTTANSTTNLNADLATRQAGTLADPATSDYSQPRASSGITTNQMSVGSDKYVVNNADFLPTLTAPGITGFTLSFKLAGGGTNWTSPFLSTHPPVVDERGSSELGLLVYADGTVQAYATGPDKAATNDAINTALGGTWNRAAQNTYELIATTTTTTTGTYDVFINGVEVISDVAYTLSTGGSNGEINWEVRNPANGTGLYDDFQLKTVSPPVPPYRLTITRNGPNFDFSWDSKPGKVYDLLTSTDLASPIADWPIYDDGVMLHQNIPATGITTTLTAVPSSDPQRFFSMREEDAPPLLAVDFEATNGGFTTSKTAGTDWEWGTPASAGLGGTVNTGNAGSAKCWGTGIGNPGFYADPTTESCLISPVIDLTSIAAAELSFAHAIDIDTPGADTAVLRVVNADTNAVISSFPFPDGDTGSAAWQTAAPITLPVGAPIRLHWCLTGTGGEDNDFMGWYIDDVTVVQTFP